MLYSRYLSTGYIEYICTHGRYSVTCVRRILWLAVCGTQYVLVSSRLTDFVTHTHTYLHLVLFTRQLSRASCKLHYWPIPQFSPISTILTYTFMSFKCVLAWAIEAYVCFRHLLSVGWCYLPSPALVSKLTQMHTSRSTVIQDNRFYFALNA